MSVVNGVHNECGEMEISNEMLVSRAKSGDVNAFVELIERHADKVFQTTYQVTRNRQDTEDALQESFLRAFIHLKEFQERSSFSTWLTRIAINSALMILRKKRNCSEVPIDRTDGPAGNFENWEPRSPWEDPESRYVRRESHELLRQAIQQLPPVSRDVIELLQVKEYSCREIAQSLGISVPAVKSRLARARKALRTSLLRSNSR
jgi:RNA polymerase sigma-70 factor, ECF subfamily